MHTAAHQHVFPFPGGPVDSEIRWKFKEESFLQWIFDDIRQYAVPSSAGICKLLELVQEGLFPSSFHYPVLALSVRGVAFSFD